MELHVIECEGRETVVLLDNEMRIVKPVYDYLKFQRQKDKALNTLKASPLDDVVAVKKDKIQLKDEKIATLREQVKKLEDDKKKLIVQLVDYEELKSENERLKKQLAKRIEVRL